MIDVRLVPPSVWGPEVARYAESGNSSDPWTDPASSRPCRALGPAGRACRHHAEARSRARAAVRAERARGTGCLAETLSAAAGAAAAHRAIGARRGQRSRLRRAEPRQADRARGVCRDRLHLSPLPGRHRRGRHRRRVRGVRRQPRANRVSHRRAARRGAALRRRTRQRRRGALRAVAVLPIAGARARDRSRQPCAAARSRRRGRFPGRRLALDANTELCAEATPGSGRAWRTRRGPPPGTGRRPARIDGAERVAEPSAGARRPAAQLRLPGARAPAATREAA